LQRAGLDYHAFAAVTQHPDWPACRDALAGRRLYAITTRGGRRYDAPRYEADDVFVFGPETRGLPDPVLETFDAERRLRIPMMEASRSLNLSNAVAVVVYEAWRQLDYRGGR